MTNQTWNGQDLTFAYAYPDSDSTYEYQTIVADGTTYQDATGSFSFSVSYISSNVEQIEISNFTDAYGSYFPAAANNGPVFFGPGGDTPIVGAMLVSTNMVGLTQSDVSYGCAVPAEQGLAAVTTGSSNDTIILGGYGNTVSAGGGMNFIGGGLGLNTFVLSNPGFDEIAGFSTSNGDTLNVAAALQAAGWNLAPATLGNYLKVTDANNNATLSVAKGGSGTGVAIAQLDGVGNLTLSTLQNHLIL
jgi:hypothetical protein